MLRGSRKAIGALLLAALTTVAVGHFFDRDPPPAPVPPSPAEVVRAKLAQRISLDVAGVPLDQVLADLAAKHDLRIELDRAAIASLQFSPDQPVTLRLRDVRLGNALSLLLMQLAPQPPPPPPMPPPMGGNLSLSLQKGGGQVVLGHDRANYAIVGDTVHVTSGEKADELVVTKVYPIVHLLAAHRQPGTFSEELLAEAIGSFGASTETLPGAVAVTGPERAHDHVARLLAVVQRTGDPMLPSPPEPSAAKVALGEALGRRAEFDFHETPLAQALADLAARYEPQYHDRRQEHRRGQGAGPRPGHVPRRGNHAGHGTEADAG